jgi:hypothetical protein
MKTNQNGIHSSDISEAEQALFTSYIRGLTIIVLVPVLYILFVGFGLR